MGKITLTAKNVLTLGEGEHWDAALPRFVLRVRASGVRTYALRYSVGRRTKRQNIGDVKTLSLEAARAEARKLLAGLWTGTSPKVAAAAALARERTVAAIAQEFFEAMRLSDAVRREWKRRWDREVQPRLGNLLAGDVTPDDISSLLSVVVKRGAPVSANRLYTFVHRLFSWAKDQRMLVVSPCDGVQKPYSGETSSDRVLSADELRALVLALDDMQDRAALAFRGRRRKGATTVSSPMGDAVLLLLLTGVRRRSVLGAETDQFEDLETEDRRWVIPGRLMKSGKSFVVPLSRQAAVVVARRIAAAGGTRHLFPRGRVTRVQRSVTLGWSSKWMSALAKRMDLRLGREAEAWTAHNLRHTLATHLEERLGVRDKISSLLLAHVHGSASDRIYSRASLLPERREALQKYADWIDTLRRSDLKGVAGDSVGTASA